MFDVASDEMWTSYLEEVNDLMIEEKQARHENDHIKLGEICSRIVSSNFQFAQSLIKNLVIYSIPFRSDYLTIRKSLLD